MIWTFQKYRAVIKIIFWTWWRHVTEKYLREKRCKRGNLWPTNDQPKYWFLIELVCHCLYHVFFRINWVILCDSSPFITLGGIKGLIGIFSSIPNRILLAFKTLPNDDFWFANDADDSSADDSGLCDKIVSNWACLAFRLN